MEGWIKIYRKIADSSIFADPYLFRLWIYLLLKATYVKRGVLIDKAEIILEPGQLVTGRKSLSEEYNKLLSAQKKVPESTLWHWLKKLEKWEKINIKSTNKYSIVSILNWERYQGVSTTNEHQVDSGLTKGEQEFNNG